jgi:3-oxoacyl-[acyl-carrier-protein] synthase-3
LSEKRKTTKTIRLHFKTFFKKVINTMQDLRHPLEGYPITKAVITGWGSSVPSRVLTNQALEQMVDTSNEWIVSRTGIRERHVLSEGESNFTLALEAAKKALQKAELPADELNLIIVGTCSPDFLVPSTACLLQDALNASRAGAFDLNATCSGFLYGLTVGSQLIKSGDYSNILVVGSETITRFVDYSDRNTCVLFGDGAGAVVLQARGFLAGAGGKVQKGVGAFTLRALGEGGKFLNIPAGGSRRPATIETVMAGEHFVKMQGQDVFKLAVRAMSESSLEVLTKEGLDIKEIDLVIPHQANIRIIEGVARRLQIPEEKVWINIDRYGNTSAASIPISICEAVEGGRLQPGMKVLVSAFGGGLTWASGIIYWGE